VQKGTPALWELVEGAIAECVAAGYLEA
jgi:hypothetical protein